MTNHTDYFRPDALPIHYRDDVAEVCSQSGHGLMAAGCPRGCSGALIHYSNDGHRDCQDTSGLSGRPRGAKAVSS